MRKKFATLRNLALGAGIVIALAFGATEAMASDPCTPLPPHTCKYRAEPDEWCVDFCVQNNYPPDDARCLTTHDCCICLEK